MSWDTLEEIRAAAHEWLNRATRERNRADIRRARRALVDINKAIYDLTEGEL